MALDITKPDDDGLLINAPSYIRANWEALALGTDPALLITNAKCASNLALPDSKLAQITTAAKVSGTALILLPNIPAGAGIIPVANIDTGVSANKILKLDSSAKIPAVDGSLLINLNATQLITGTVPPARLGSGSGGATKFLREDSTFQEISGSLSNVVFMWFGSDSGTTDISGWVSGTNLTPNMGVYTPTYNFFGALYNTYRTRLFGKFKKVAGVNTISIYARIWATNAAQNALLKVDIGGANNTVNRSSATPDWATPSNIDVSGLTNGTVYDITIQLQESTNASAAYLSAVMLIAS